MISGRRDRLRHLLCEALAASTGQISEIDSTLAIFGPEADAYCEAIASPGGGAAGFMIRGEGPDFTARAAALMADWRLPAVALAYHRHLAARMDHRRAFLKLEWHRRPDGGHDRMVAFYYRRRPDVAEVLRWLGDHGVGAESRQALADMASALQKDTAHFVAAAAYGDQPALHHRLYLSQYVTPGRLPAVTKRVQAVMAQLQISPAAAAGWRPVHERLLQDREITLFVSARFTEGPWAPSLKFDYPDVAPGAFGEWLDEPARGAAEARQMIEGAGLRRLSYLGARLTDGPTPRLKYYVDPRGT